MKNRIFAASAMLAAVLFVSVTVMEQTAHARAGGGRSMGSRGTRSYSVPGPAYRTPAPSRPSVQPSQRPFQQPQSGGFLRSMAGGIMGGLLGGMLFSSLGFAGNGAFGGGGFGLIEILLIAGIGYLVFRMVRRKTATAGASGFGTASQRSGTEGWGGRETPAAAPYRAYGAPAGTAEVDDVETGLERIRAMDRSFDEAAFRDGAMDLFFRVQGAWMNRDLAPVSGLLTDEMKRTLQDDADRLLRERRTNRLEQIAVRRVEIAEAWQEAGNDYLTVLVQANLLDYVTDDATGSVVSGSRTEPVKFEEYWTLVRPIGSGPWKLSAIQQKE